MSVMVAMLLFNLTNLQKYLVPMCVLEGFGVGLFISTTAALLVRMAGGTIGASAVGIVYSMKYLLISVMTPLMQYIGDHVNQVANGWIYFALHSVAIGSIIIAISKDPGLGWWLKK